MLPNVIIGLQLCQPCSNVDWLPVWHMQCYFQLGKTVRYYSVTFQITVILFLKTGESPPKKNCIMFMLSKVILFLFMLTVLTVLSMKSKTAISMFDSHVSVHRNIIPNYNEQDAMFLDLFIYFYRHATCFRRSLHPSSEAHNCTYRFLLLWMRWNCASSISSTKATSSSIG